MQLKSTYSINTIQTLKYKTTVFALWIKSNNGLKYTFTRRFYPKRLTVHSGYTFFLSVHVFPGNRTHNLCTALPLSHRNKYNIRLWENWQLHLWFSLCAHSILQCASFTVYLSGLYLNECKRVASVLSNICCLWHAQSFKRLFMANCIISPNIKHAILYL